MLKIVYYNNISDLSPLKFKIIKCFTIFCLRYFNINNIPCSVILLPKKNKENVTTGAFQIETNTIFVRFQGRALIDCLRTIAHETVHFNQKLTNQYKLGDEIPDIGGKIEDEANAIAGQLIKIFKNKYNAKFIYEI